MMCAYLRPVRPAERKRRLPWAALGCGVAVSLFSPMAIVPAAAQTYLDGGTFVISDNAYQTSDIFLGQTTPATLFLKGGAQIASLNAYRTSAFNLINGEVGSVTDLHDNATLYMTGGAIPTLLLDNNSRAQIGGGFIDSIYANDKSQVFIQGGSIARVGGFGSDLIFITGGSIGELNVQSVTTTVSMTGGAVDDFVSVGSVLIRGGSLNGNTLRAIDQGTYTLYGFKYHLSSGIRGVDDLTGQSGNFFTVTGYLPDGAPVNTTLFDADGGKQIGDPNSPLQFVTLVSAPEPTSFALLGCGSVALGFLAAASGVVRKRRFAGKSL